MQASASSMPSARTPFNTLSARRRSPSPQPKSRTRVPASMRLRISLCSGVRRTTAPASGNRISSVNPLIFSAIGHSRESGNPARWTPAYAGVTTPANLRLLLPAMAKKVGDERTQLLRLQQEGIVPEIGLNFGEDHVGMHAAQSADNFFRLVGREQPVR